ncbi:MULTISPECIES: hypothetical protein [unclassified Flavobacterium]|uniref:hypothetical protein n=1 Tax=unclassified Flavobacterium TaxID=196869 RepID=UPI001ACA9E76|nr:MULTISPECIES: hypothetical protein [unclassified Flavobacterium]MBN9283064.1 hypothetical protein [Flavobacterium sp.]
MKKLIRNSFFSVPSAFSKSAGKLLLLAMLLGTVNKTRGQESIKTMLDRHIAKGYVGLSCLKYTPRDFQDYYLSIQVREGGGAKALLLQLVNGELKEIASNDKMFNREYRPMPSFGGTGGGLGRAGQDVVIFYNVFNKGQFFAVFSPDQKDGMLYLEAFYSPEVGNIVKAQFGTLSFKDFDITTFAEKYLVRPVRYNNTNENEK